MTDIRIIPTMGRNNCGGRCRILVHEKNGEIIPVEVKAADNTQAKSYKQFCKKVSPKTGFKVSLKNIAENLCENTRTISLPLYMVWNLERYL